MTSLGIVPGINFFVSGHFLILFIDLTNLPEALCVQKICRGIIHFDPTIQVDTIVHGTYNVGTWSSHLFVLFQLLQVQFRYRLKIPKPPEQDSIYTSKSKIFAPS